jgi:hypothetical protein
MLSGGTGGTSSQWTTNGNNIYYTTGNTGIGTSTITNKLEIYGGDINVTTGTIKKTTLGSGSTYNPIVWYQFEQDPTITTTLNDSSTIGTKYNMNFDNFFNDTSSMEAWYKFDNNLTDMLLDSSGKSGSRVLTNMNSASYEPIDKRKGTGSIRLNRTLSPKPYLTIPSTVTSIISSTAAANGITFSIWMKNVNSLDQGRIFEFSNSSGANNAIIFLRDGVEDNYAFILKNNGTQVFVARAVIDKNWHHIVWSISSTNVSTIYIDNVSIAILAQGTVPTLTGTPRGYIGQTFYAFEIINDPSSYTFGGYLDDFRIYNKLLSVAEISIIYNTSGYSTFFNDTTNLYFWYKFDSANLFKNDGLTGSTYDLVETTANTFLASTSDKKVGTASCSFPSSANSKTLRTNNTYNFATNFTTAITISFWAKVTSLNGNGWDTFMYPYNVSSGSPIFITRHTTSAQFLIQGFGHSVLPSGQIYPIYSAVTYTANNVWDHYVVTFEKQTTNINLKVYRNNSLLVTQLQTSVTWSPPNGGFSLGTVGPNNMFGLMDDYRIYNKVLSLEEIAVLYNNSPNILNKITGYTTNSYLYQNAYLWNGNATSAVDNVCLTYDGATNIQTLLNTIHTSTAFSIHFVFSTANNSGTSQILFIGNTAIGDLIRIFITATSFTFKVGAASASATITANTPYVADLICTYIIGGNMNLIIYLNNSLITTNNATAYNNLFLNVNTSGLVYFIGKYTDINDASPVTLQDFRIYASALDASTISSLQYATTTYVHPTITVNTVRQTPTWISGNEYYYAFTSTTATNAITFSQDTICDVLVIGGGGAGGYNTGGGGGSGACIVSLGYQFAAGTYNVTVGAGGTIVTNTSGNNGGDSSIGNVFLARGGGGGSGGAQVTANVSGKAGGSSGGSGATNSENTSIAISPNPLTTNTVNAITNIAPGASGVLTTGQTYIVLGTKGGNSTGISGTTAYAQYNGGGGGGVGESGVDGSRSAAGRGGNGVYSVTVNNKSINFKSYFSPNNSFGVADPANPGNFYIGGGGGAGGYEGTPINIAGGLGGGGIGKDGDSSGTSGSGINNTGAGGGGGCGNVSTPGAGGSGIVIIRYTAPQLASTTNEEYALKRWNDSTTYLSGSKFITYTEGNVGIGISNPVTKLHVGTGSYATGTQNLRYFNYATPETAGSTALSDTAAVFDTSIWVKSFIASSSDERIKKNIADIDDDSALQKIRAIQPKTYNYIDSARGNNKVYGFIAQQIKDIIPEAVTTQNELIPNIFSTAECAVNVIKFPSNILINESIISSKINLIDLYGKRDTYTIIDVDIQSNSVTIDGELAGNQVFVYGTEVNDFHTLDKSYIYTLNVCATQMLSDKVNNLTSQIQDLYDIINTMKALLPTNISNISQDSSNISQDLSNIPSDSSNIPLDSSNILSDSSNIPLDSSNIPLDSSNIPLDSSNILSDSSNILSDSSNIPLDSSNILSDSSNIPLDSSNIPLDSSNIPLDSSNIPLDMT